jgi:hypothetical protein
MRRFAIPLFLLVSAPAWAGARYDYEIVHSGAKDWVIKSSVEIEGAQQRVGFADVSAYMTATAQSEYRKDAFAISSDGGNNATFFYPGEKQLLHKQFGAAGVTHGFSIEIESPKVKVRDLGDGGVIAGMPTHKCEIELSFSRVVDVGGNRTSGKLEYVSDVWTTDQIAASDTTFIMNRFFRDQMPPEINQLIDAQLSDKHFVIRRVTTVRVPIKGEMVTSVTTESMTNHRAGSIPDSEFALPAGYDEVRHAPLPQK